MKTLPLPALFLPIACLTLVACSKPAEPAAEPTPSVAGIPAAAIAKAEKVAAQVEAKYADIAVDATDLYTQAVAKTKALLGEQKYSEALTALDSLKGVALGAEQQKAVEELRAQIAKGLDLLKPAQDAKTAQGT